jgi:hypothetical protein
MSIHNLTRRITITLRNRRYLEVARSATALLLLGYPVAAQTGPYRPTLTPNSQKYRDNGLKKDGNTFLELTTGDLDNPAAAPGNISKVQVKLLRNNGTTVYENYNNLEVGGYFTQSLPNMFRRQPLQLQANVRGIDPTRTDGVTIAEQIKLRPDPVADRLTGPAQAFVNTTVNLEAVIREANGDSGARADCVLYVNGAETDRATPPEPSSSKLESRTSARAITTRATTPLQHLLRSSRSRSHSGTMRRRLIGRLLTQRRTTTIIDITTVPTPRHATGVGDTTVTAPMSSMPISGGGAAKHWRFPSNSCVWRFDLTNYVQFQFCTGSTASGSHSDLYFYRYAGRIVCELWQQRNDAGRSHRSSNRQVR